MLTPPLTPVGRRSVDYSDLEHCMAQLNLVLRQTRRSLDALARGAPAGAGSIPALGDREVTNASPVPAADTGVEWDQRPGAPPAGAVADVVESGVASSPAC